MPSPPPAQSKQGEDNLDQEPLGLQHPLLPARPLGQTWLSPKFLSPLGARPIAALNPTIFLKQDIPGYDPLVNALPDFPLFAESLAHGDEVSSTNPTQTSRKLDAFSAETMPPTIKRQSISELPIQRKESLSEGSDSIKSSRGQESLPEPLDVEYGQESSQVSAIAPSISPTISSTIPAEPTSNTSVSQLPSADAQSQATPPVIQRQPQVNSPVVQRHSKTTLFNIPAKPTVSAPPDSASIPTAVSPSMLPEVSGDRPTIQRQTEPTSSPLFEGWDLGGEEEQDLGNEAAIASSEQSEAASYPAVESQTKTSISNHSNQSSNPPALSTKLDSSSSSERSQEPVQQSNSSSTLSSKPSAIQRSVEPSVAASKAPSSPITSSPLQTSTGKANDSLPPISHSSKSLLSRKEVVTDVGADDLGNPSGELSGATSTNVGSVEPTPINKSIQQQAANLNQPPLAQPQPPAASASLPQSTQKVNPLPQIQKKSAPISQNPVPAQPTARTDAATLESLSSSDSVVPQTKSNPELTTAKASDLSALTSELIQPSLEDSDPSGETIQLASDDVNSVEEQRSPQQTDSPALANENAALTSSRRNVATGNSLLTPPTSEPTIQRRMIAAQLNMPLMSPSNVSTTPDVSKQTSASVAPPAISEGLGDRSVNRLEESTQEAVYTKVEQPQTEAISDSVSHVSSTAPQHISTKTDSAVSQPPSSETPPLPVVLKNLSTLNPLSTSPLLTEASNLSGGKLAPAAQPSVRSQASLDTVSMKAEPSQSDVLPVVSAAPVVNHYPTASPDYSSPGVSDRAVSSLSTSNHSISDHSGSASLQTNSPTVQRQLAASQEVFLEAQSDAVGKREVSEHIPDSWSSIAELIGAPSESAPEQSSRAPASRSPIHIQRSTQNRQLNSPVHTPISNQSTNQFEDQFESQFEPIFYVPRLHQAEPVINRLVDDVDHQSNVESVTTSPQSSTRSTTDAVTAEIQEADIGSSSSAASTSNDSNANKLDELAWEVYHLLRQRLKVDQERQGNYYSGRLPY